MRNLTIHFIVVLLALAPSACSYFQQEPIQIENPWIREAPPNSSAMAGYLKIINTSKQSVKLISASSPAFKVIEFHRSTEKNGVYKMIRHENLTVPAKATLELKPGDYHLMLITPQKHLAAGDSVEITLVFSNQTSMPVTFQVEKGTYQ